MLRHLIVLSALTLSLSACCSVARADYFVWSDPQTGASLSFPDTWRLVNNRESDTIVTIAGPSTADQPVCRLRAHSDKRFLVYPVWYSASVQRTAFDEFFWEEYVGQYGPASLHTYKDDAGIGKAFASMAIVSYNPHTPGGADPQNLRVAQMWGGAYHENAWVFDCSVMASAYTTWQPDFASIAKSVDLRKAHHELATGHYTRNFLKEEPMSVPVMNGKREMGRTWY